jgi:elongator complex protein 3
VRKRKKRKRKKKKTKKKRLRKKKRTTKPTKSNPDARLAASESRSRHPYSVERATLWPMSTESDVTETDAFERVCEELIDRILAGDIERDDLESAKLDVCSDFSAPKVPKNTEILDHAPDERREELEEVLQRKPVRTASGVSPVAIMTSPHTCPHGKCLYCPGGPASEFTSSQSYTGHEPAAARGEQNDYDPYGQVTLRLEQLREIGHPVDKVELILMGGTMTARSHDYQEWFVKRALEAMNDYDLDKEPDPAEGESFAQDPDEYEFSYLADVIAENETGDIRNIGTTFETKPDWCDPEQIDRMLDLGGTKVEVGVQTTYERINREMHRGHGVQASIDANRRLRDAAFKVGFHMMPGQPGMSQEMCLEDFHRIFDDPKWRPDYLKIYPTLVVRGTLTYDMWYNDEYDPLTNEEAAELVARIKKEIPRYTRLQRVQRDIPADFIDAGVWKSNLRQLARQKMEEYGWTCDCIRCREAGMNDEGPENVELDVMTYEAGGGTEQFISFEDFEKNLLVGFCRLRFPNDPVRRELDNAALVRELHVYGSEAGIGQDAETGQHQHKGYGRRLMERAEDMAADAGFDKVSVISGIGAREYYRQKLGYHQDGPYVSKQL